MERLCRELVARLNELAYVDMDRVAIRFCQTRRAGHHGLHASLTPLRFRDGAREQQRGGRIWTIQPVHNADGREMLYLLSFYLPRFLNQPLRAKLATVVHELWHISPEFNGDLRRFPGRCYAHGAREAEFHRHVEGLAEAWLALDPPETCYAFLQHNFSELQSCHGRVIGMRIPTPKLVRVR